MPPLPLLGIAAALVGFGLLVVGMWSEPDSAPFWKTMGTGLVAAVFMTVVSLIALPALAPRFRWAVPSAAALGVVVAALGIAAIWAETTDGTFWRVFGGFFVALAALTLAIPALQRMSRREVEAGPRLRFCPACGRGVASDASACAGCGARFAVRFE